ncbi:hypothetical protein ACROYT_G006580 [Oculina patagonica]
MTSTNFTSSDTKIRLTGHNASYAGRVEVFSHGVWGRVMQLPYSCDQAVCDQWSQKEATVVCRQLGFPGAITALSYSPFGDGSGQVLMNNVKCTGSEKTIQQCRYSDWVSSSVPGDYRYEVGVICKTGYSDLGDSDIPIRLQGSSVPNAGRVEVLYQGIWGAISRKNWDINAATVACRQLGYQAGAEAALTNVVYGPVSGPVWLTNLQCSGSENNLMSCSHDGIGNKSHLQWRWNVASVICKNGSVPNGMSVRVRGSHATNIGRVEVYYAGKWGTIDYNNWDINDAKVVCRELGYSTAFSTGYGLFCSPDVPPWFTNFSCYGNESHLDQCARDFLTGWSYSGYWSYKKPCANVVCKDRMADLGFEMRLRGSSVPHAGRVELRFNGVWGTIGHKFKYRRPVDPRITRVICRQLNFTDSVFATDWPVFGWGTGPQWFDIDDLHCLGNETNLLNCSHREPHSTREDLSAISVVCKPDVPQTNGSAWG